MVAKLKEEFADYDLTYSIGGQVRARQAEPPPRPLSLPPSHAPRRPSDVAPARCPWQISFDLFPKGWDKTFCLRYLPEADFDEIHFFGDKFFVGGNDYEIYEHPRTIGHAIKDADPMTTLKILSETFGIPCPEKLSPPGSH